MVDVSSRTRGWVPAFQFCLYISGLLKFDNVFGSFLVCTCLKFYHFFDSSSGLHIFAWNPSILGISTESNSNLTLDIIL